MKFFSPEINELPGKAIVFLITVNNISTMAACLFHKTEDCRKFMDEAIRFGWFKEKTWGIQEVNINLDEWKNAANVAVITYEKGEPEYSSILLKDYIQRLQVN